MTATVETSAAAAGKPGYTPVAIVLHWLIAALLIFQVGLGLRMQHAQGPAKFAAFQLHKSVGITILLLTAIRLLWRWYRRPPHLVVTGWQRALAHGVHLLLYGLLLALPLSGWVIISSSRIEVPTLLYGTIPWPHVPGFATMAAATRDMWHSAAQFSHGALVKLLYGLFALHLAGALKHQLLDRDDEMARMVPGIRPGRWSDPRLIAIGLGMVLAAALGRQLLPIGPAAPAVVSAAAPAPTLAPAAEESAPASNEASEAASADAVPAAGIASQPAPEPLPQWAIAAGSSLQFATTWSGTAVNGGFKTFDGDIAFSPDQLAHSHVRISVATGSVFSGDSQRDETLKSAEWFSVPGFPAAMFVADRFSKTGKDRYLAKGTLRIKGITLPLSLPFSLKISDDKAVMAGTATIDRTAYKIGEGEFSGTDEIPASVRIDVLLNALHK